MVWKTAFLFFLFFYLNVVDAYLNQNSYVRFKYQTFMSNIKRENCCQVNVGAWQCPPNGQKTCMCVCVCVILLHYRDKTMNTHSRYRDLPRYRYVPIMF